MSAVMAVGLTQERGQTGEGGERSEESQEGKRKRGGHLGEEAGGRGKPESGPAAGAGTWAPLSKETFQTGGGT